MSSNRSLSENNGGAIPITRDDDPEAQGRVIDTMEEGRMSASLELEPRRESLLREDSVDRSSSNRSSANSSRDDEGRARAVTMIGSVANLCSATLGAGILALPFAFYQAGIICGVLLLLISALATSSSIGLLVEACDRYNLSTYEKIVEKGLGRNARKLVEISILVFCCGTAVGYVIAVGDIMERVVPSLTTSQKQLSMSLVWCVAMLPLSCLKTMRSLECASSVGILSIGTLLAAAVVHLVRGDGSGGRGNDYGYSDDETLLESFSSEPASIASLLGPAGGSWVSVLQACPIFFYAFSCQVNVAQIFDELPAVRGGEKLPTMNRVTSTGVLVCGLLYASVSLVTLVDFGASVEPNVLSNYDLGRGAQPLLHAAFLGMALAVVMAFPLNIFPARVSLIQMWEETTKENNNASLSSSLPPEFEAVRQPLLSEEHRANGGGLDYNSDGESSGAAGSGEDPLHDETGSHDDVDEPGGFRPVRHAFVTLLLASLALGLALVVPNISVVFGLLGGSTSSLLGFVVPGLLGLKLDHTRVGAWVLVVCGSMIGILTTGVTIYSMVHAS
ncbi:unnamed protein product [Pseudo-nitzschia multistriata]|uniref:Amino acid transporter transmembrane domain-containing protein n=1 Tax=Pseudo-nitzschia multistriata TaxID=183589 RepID=A0A448ZEG1_9STRA|nr:unnamed protein product [Pseudo-nitzschia multistriata]